MTRKKIAVEYGLPLDLAFEILLRLPPKSVLRFKSVSKSWCSIIRSQQFINAFSLSRPRHVLLLKNHDEDQVLLFSSPRQSCSFLLSSSMSFVKDNTLTMPKFKIYIDCICNSVRGFLCCRSIRDGFVVFNLSTGQFIFLPRENDDNYSLVYLGYDPKRDQYKALRLKLQIGHLDLHFQHSVFTLGGQGSSHSWRPIKANNPDHECSPGGVCIDGVVYYKCIRREDRYKTMLSCFDVGSEQLRDIEKPEKLSERDLSEGDITNYLGKLAMYCSTFNGFNLWVLDDVKNQIWSKNTYDFPLLEDDASMFWRFRFQGITASREIVYINEWFLDPSELLCYNMEKKMGRSVRVTAVSDYYNNCSTFKKSRFKSSILCSYVDNIWTI